ncbi:hypothetical protein SAY86_009508 [Trapa natans]|uniref:Uncharacterized protein n=1 Tax=Trapa natans TaxID=22666 RepID=A0AAN7QSQ7_TRANT|nr:hypothetical protein SAY86_009508 [Trapa natans]
MGDSPTCLMQPLCYASAALSPAETSKSNPIDALGQSVSLGRFTSESLSWEKWSTFSQKRYVEEAERYSQPGSVAEKKAFFEARYKKMAEKKAETTLQEQTNAAAGDSTSNNMDLDMHVEPKEEAWEQMTDSHSVSMLDEAKVHYKEDGDVDASPLPLEFPNSTLDSGNPQSQHGTMKNDASAESRRTGNKRSLATK